MARSLVVLWLIAAAASAAEFLYFAEAGVYASRSEAELTVAKLHEQNLPAVILTRELSGKNVYRVRVGPFRDQDVYDMVADRIRALDLSVATVRVESDGRASTLDKKIKPAESSKPPGDKVERPGAAQPRSAPSVQQSAQLGRRAGAKACNTVGKDFSAATPVPNGSSPGSWSIFFVQPDGRPVVYSAGNDGPFPGQGNCAQSQEWEASKVRKLVAEAPKKAGAPVVELGGCVGQHMRAVAIPSDNSWAWEVCRYGEGNARYWPSVDAEAVKLCELKSGCKCSIWGSGGASDVPASYGVCR